MIWLSCCLSSVDDVRNNMLSFLKGFSILTPVIGRRLYCQHLQSVLILKNGFRDSTWLLLSVSIAVALMGRHCLPTVPGWRRPGSSYNIWLKLAVRLAVLVVIIFCCFVGFVCLYSKAELRHLLAYYVWYVHTPMLCWRVHMIWLARSLSERWSCPNAAAFWAQVMLRILV